MGSSPDKHSRVEAARALIARVVAVVAVCAAVMALLVLSDSTPAGAKTPSIDELNSKTDAARSRAQGLAGQIESQTGALRDERAQANAAASRESELSETLADGQARAAELATEVGRTRAELQRTRERLRRSTAALAARLVAMYKGGEPDVTQLLLSSASYDDLATRTYFLERIRAADDALVDRARDLRGQVNVQLQEVSAARDRQQAHNDAVAAARDEIAAARAQAQARAAALASSRSSRQAALGDLQAQIARWKQQLQRAEQISAAEAERQVGEMIKDWAIPEQIVLCESGGNFDAVNPASGAGGAYQILPSTWKAYGGKGLPQDASPEEQSRIAALIWADSGPSAWVCAS